MRKMPQAAAVDRKARPRGARGPSTQTTRPTTKYVPPLTRKAPKRSSQSRSVKTGKGRPIQSLLVIVFRVASPIAASPRASAATRIALDARGVVGKLSAMAARRARECSVRGRAGANAGRVLSRGGDGGEARVEAREGRAPGGERGEGGCGAGERERVAEADVRGKS